MSILTQLVGDKKLHDLDTRVDNLVSNLNTGQDEQSSDDLTSDTIGSILSQEGSESGSEDEMSKLFQSVSIPQARLARYQMYTEIRQSVPIITKIIQKYVSNILSKNPVDNRILITGEQEQKAEDSNKYYESKTFSESFAKHFDLQYKLKNLITPSALTYGDYFVEIVSVSERSKNLDFNKSYEYTANASSATMLTEAKQLLTETEQMSGRNFEEGNFDRLFSDLAELCLDVEVAENEGELLTDQDDQSTDTEVNTDEGGSDENSSQSLTDFSDVLLKYHKPHKIIILNTDFGTRVGYLEVEDQQQVWGHSLSQTISSAVSKISSIGKRNDVSQTELTNKLVQHALKKITSKIKEKTNNVADADLNEIIKQNLGDEAFENLKRMMIEQGFDKKKNQVKPLKVRFISTERMVQFNTPSIDYEPYGQSIIENLVLPSKLYMLTQLSNAVHKLSRSSLVRTWRIDTGTSRMASDSIQKLKRELHNTRVTLDDLGSFKSLPKIMSD